MTLGGHSIPGNDEAFYRIEVGVINSFPRRLSDAGFGHYCSRISGTYGDYLSYRDRGISMTRPNRC
jgi:hypothetical protein